MVKLQIFWDKGTAYDFFISQWALYNPSKVGLRGTWAAGVRARLPTQERETLEQALFLDHSYCWVYFLPEPKDGATVLEALRRLEPADRITTLSDAPDLSPHIKEIRNNVAARHRWDDDDLQQLSVLNKTVGSKLPKDMLVNMLTWWADLEMYGDRLLQALETFHDVFFAEEEKRIQPMIAESLARAQRLAEKLPLPDLFEEISQGARFTETLRTPELVLAPSFWTTPLICDGLLSPTRELILFGARPADASLVPGDVVPHTLSMALKALADPTRLRILRYLRQEPLSPAALSRRLRLRAPTVVHHLHTLRLAGLVYVTLGPNDQRRYTARHEAVDTTFAALQTFLAQDDT